MVVVDKEIVFSTDVVLSLPSISSAAKHRRRVPQAKFVPTLANQPRVWRIKPEPPSTKLKNSARLGIHEVRKLAISEVGSVQTCISIDSPRGRLGKLSRELSSCTERFIDVTQQEAELQKRNQIASEISLFRHKILQREIAGDFRREIRDRQQDWVGRRKHAEDTRLHLDEVDLLRSWFKSLDMDSTGTISFSDLEDPLFRYFQCLFNDSRRRFFSLCMWIFLLLRYNFQNRKSTISGRTTTRSATARQ
jgi:hypothetical protein